MPLGRVWRTPGPPCWPRAGGARRYGRGVVRGPGGGPGADRDRGSRAALRPGVGGGHGPRPGPSCRQGRGAVLTEDHDQRCRERAAAHAMITSVVLADGPRSPSPGLLEALRERRRCRRRHRGSTRLPEHLGSWGGRGARAAWRSVTTWRNGIGVLHGGVVAGLVDAPRRTRGRRGPHGRSADLLVRYVAAGAHGPGACCRGHARYRPRRQPHPCRGARRRRWGRLVALATARSSHTRRDRHRERLFARGALTAVPSFTSDGCGCTTRSWARGACRACPRRCRGRPARMGTPARTAHAPVPLHRL